MVRLADLQSDFEFVGTAGQILGTPITKDRVRNIWRMRVRQRGATVSVFSLKAQQGATVFATLDVIQFPNLDAEYDFPGGPILENSVPLYKIRSDDATAAYGFSDNATVQTFIQYTDDMDQ